MRKTQLLLIAGIFLFSCSIDQKNEIDNFPEEQSYNYEKINSLIEKNELEKAISVIEERTPVDKTDSLNLLGYRKFITANLKLQGNLPSKERDVLNTAIIEACNGNFTSPILGSNGSKSYDYSSAFAYGWINLDQNPGELMLTCSYDDTQNNFYYHIITDVSVISKGIKLNLGHGYGVNGQRESRPLKFNISKYSKTIEKLLENEDLSVVFHTARTYNDRAYYNGAIWDIKSGEKISYNSVSDFNIRKNQIMTKGEVLQFRVPINSSAKRQLTSLIHLQKLLQ